VGAKRGLVLRSLRRRSFLRDIEMEHLLRSVYEVVENHEIEAAPVERLLTMRSWSPAQLRSVIRRAGKSELVRPDSRNAVRLTARGAIEAKRLTRQHRLWELYLITHAEVAPSKVDRGADAIEHVLDPETIHELELLLDDTAAAAPPASPHVIGGATP
jgi:manganese/zinc/iron transport system permease protein